MCPTTISCRRNRERPRVSAGIVINEETEINPRGSDVGIPEVNLRPANRWREEEKGHSVLLS